MMLLGMVWALAAPLLLVLAGALVAWWLAAWQPGWPRAVRLGVSGLLVLAPVLALYVPARLAFHRACDDIGTPQVMQRLPVDGFFLDDSTANSFGMRYLHDEGFAWIEARSIYRRDGFTRYTHRQDGSIATEETDRTTARVKVSAPHEALGPGLSVQRIVITDLPTGTVLARAGMVHFDGGLAKRVLGMYGSASCPNPAWPGGSEHFKLYDHLAKATLR